MLDEQHRPCSCLPSIQRPATSIAKLPAFKGKKDRDPKCRYVNFSYSRQPVFVKQYYFYIDDADFGPCFIKIGTYAPFPVRICINGHQWARRQIEAFFRT